MDFVKKFIYFFLKGNQSLFLLGHETIVSLILRHLAKTVYTQESLIPELLVIESQIWTLNTDHGWLRCYGRSKLTECDSVVAHLCNIPVVRVMAVHIMVRALHISLCGGTHCYGWQDRMGTGRARLVLDLLTMAGKRWICQYSEWEWIGHSVDGGVPTSDPS